MGKKDIKEEIYILVERQNDHHILEAIRTILKKTNLNTELKEKLTSRALKSEQDISKSRLMDRKKFEKNLNDKFGI
jgi:hypothetical protein